MMGGMGGSKEEKPTSDGWFMKKLPVLQQAKVVIIPLFFVFAYCQGWVGRWGLIMGAFSKSYFDMLAVPFRWWPRSPAFGKALIYNQFYVDSFF